MVVIWPFDLAEGSRSGQKRSNFEMHNIKQKTHVSGPDLSHESNGVICCFVCSLERPQNAIENVTSSICTHIGIIWESKIKISTWNLEFILIRCIFLHIFRFSKKSKILDFEVMFAKKSTFLDFWGQKAKISKIRDSHLKATVISFLLPLFVCSWGQHSMF